ncbi:MAG: hypothetical protein RBT73_09300 [Spirochaetia bacterium]|jgi:hypothetical protein|nr:hypothetical protein [Spirochaetia bacterium]
MTLRCQGKPAGCKLLRIEAEIDMVSTAAPLIRSILIRGDFFAIPEEVFEALEFSLVDIPLEGFAACFDAKAGELGLQMAGIHGEGVESVIRSALNGV